MFTYAQRMNQRNKRKVRKFRMMDYRGGECVKCKKTTEHIHWTAFQFNHIDPSKKSFSIADNKCISWKKLTPELDKCELVCANCHSEITYNQRIPRKKRIGNLIRSPQ